MTECIIYRSEKKIDTYLYVRVDVNLASLPVKLIHSFGEKTKVMELDLAQREKLAFANINHVRQALKGQGFYLQLPPQTPINKFLEEIASSSHNK